MATDLLALCTLFSLCHIEISDCVQWNVKYFHTFLTDCFDCVLQTYKQ